MEFWEEGTKYQIRYNQKKAIENERFAQKIYKKYITKAAESRVEIQDEVRDKIKDRIKDHNITVELYDEAISEVRQLILAKHAHLFNQSRYALLSENTNQWLNEFSNMSTDIKQAVHEYVNIILHPEDNKVTYISTVKSKSKMTIKSKSRKTSCKSKVSMSSSKVVPFDEDDTKID